MGSGRTWLSRCQQKKNCSHHTAGPVSQRTRAGRQGAHSKAPWLQINFPRKRAKAPTPRSWISTGCIPGSQRLGCGSGFQFPLTEGGHRVCSAAGAVETPLLCIVTVSALLCYFQTRKGHRDPRETRFPPSLELLFLPRTCFCCHLLPNAGTNAGVWQSSKPWLVGWERGILGPQPRDRALLHVHCQVLQLQFWCPSHAESIVLTCLGMGSTPGCWAANPVGDPWKVDGNSWSRTQSYVNPSMLLWLSCTYSGKRRSQRCLERLFPKYA